MIWPLDVRSFNRSCRSIPEAAVTTARATILGPSHLPLPSHIHAEDIFRLAPAKILISAIFQPGFQLVRGVDDDMQLPCVRNIKMDISVKKLAQHSHELYLQSFQMILVGYTDIRAGATTHGYMSFWTLRSLSNLGLRIFTADDACGVEHWVDSKLWDGVKLDDSIVPDFASCNLERRYELEVLLGWQCRSGEHAGRVFFVQARTPVRVSSGIQRSIQIGKPLATWAGDDIAGTVDREKSHVLSDEELRKTRTRFSAPPTYDEAVRTAVKNRLEGCTTSNAAGG